MSFTSPPHKNFSKISLSDMETRVQDKLLSGLGNEREQFEAVITEWYRHIGRRGGAKTSDAKRTASVANAEKARAARAEKRRLRGMSADA